MIERGAQRRPDLTPTTMKIHPPAKANRMRNSAAILAFLLILGVSAEAFAQQKVSRHFPTGKNVRLELKNISGTITVETWAREEIKITATMEAPTARFNPRQTDAGLVIDIVSVVLMVGGSIPGETKTIAIAIYDRVQAFDNRAAATMSAT